MAVEPEFAEYPLHRGAAGIHLAVCDREPIHIPGAIQPHGLLLIADLATQTVIGGAGAIEERLTPSWLGRPLGALLAQPIESAVKRAQATTMDVVPLAAVPGRREAFDATLHIADNYIVAELEPRPDEPLTAGAILGSLDHIGAGFELAGDLRTLCDRAATAFRELTGFDRVMIYRFLDDGTGMVVAEDRDPSLSSFLNHRFPASDIPQQARQLYIRNRVRVIPDARYTPIPIRSAKTELAGIDLSDAALRSVSPIHLQYLHNMRVIASASVSIVKDGLLWGLVACHHQAPRGIAYEIRAACRLLAGGLARQIRAKEEAELYRDRIRLRQTEDAIVARFDVASPFDLFFEAKAEELRLMLDADGFAAVQGEHVRSAGTVPDPADLKALARWLGPRTALEPFATATLGERYPPAAAYAEIASGLMAVSLTTEVSILMIWFRAEQTEIVEWAGNPHKERPLGADEILSPRSSFEAWREEVRGHARRWTISELEAANRLRHALFELRQRRRLRELNRELNAIITEKGALLAQKDYLLGEANHRVQNSLQLVQAFLALQSREDLPEVAEHLAEAQRRIAAVALVHRRLYQADRVDAVDLARYLDDLVGDMRQAMGGEWQGAITTDLSPILVSPDRAVNVGLVLTELVINAQKHAYRGRPGPIAITLELYRNKLRLIVADQGVGARRPGQGFGTRMIGAIVDRLDGAIERLDNRPGLRVIVTAPSEND
ncbi:histidine kinase dimerization/phosphoacceptor domain -containing protein [Sphingomonas sp. MMS24-J13]|uniref:histidine kinase dimerization/phosphoacceptor domain -containing protein n=1 Tax=Sphingomonas sp. MMS24-J13 TaxID=3238686 RepID=UPI00384D5914